MKENFYQKIIDDNKFLALNRIIRWAGEDTIKQETVGGHSHDVTLFLRALVEEIFPFDAYQIKLEIVTDGTVHDIDEIFSGDVTHKVKYNPFNGTDIKKSLEAYCLSELQNYFGSGDKSANMFLEATTNVSPYSKALTKVADWFSMCVFCRKEVNFGNKRFESKLRHCVVQLNIACETAEKELKKMEFDGELDLSSLVLIKKLIW